MRGAFKEGRVASEYHFSLFNAIKTGAWSLFIYHQGSKHLRVAAENASEHAVNAVCEISDISERSVTQRNPAVAVHAPWGRAGRAEQRGERSGQWN